MKVAIAIIVKDEATDILPWICWYFNLKTNTILIYDDSSGDGTFELVQDASKVRDIRLKRVDPSIDFYTTRQRDCYIRILTEHAEEFDWIGFFDADEYLALPNDQNLPEFLDRPQDIGAVAVNWCNYGSGGHVLKPRMPPFYAYNTHYARREPINRHVKTFVRPKRWVKGWHNPHFFDVSPLRYDDASGQPVTWSEQLGITLNEAKWDDAKLMHFQCRSMEHFIERIRKRPDIPAHPSLWVAYDRGEIEDNEPRRQFENVARIMHSMIIASISRVIHSCSEQEAHVTPEPIRRPNFSSSQSSLSVERNPLTLFRKDSMPKPTNNRQRFIKILKVMTHFGEYLEISPPSARICVTNKSGTPHGGQEVYAILTSNLPGMLFLCTGSKSYDALIVEEDPRLCNLLAYEVVQLEDSNLVALRHPSTRMFLSCQPSANGGGTSASRHLVNLWEKFNIVEIDSDREILKDDARVALIESFMWEDCSLRRFFSTAGDKDLQMLCSVFPVLVAIADQEERQKFKVMCGAASHFIF